VPLQTAPAGPAPLGGAGLHEWALTGGVKARSTSWYQGDMAAPGPLGERRRRAVVDLPWTLLRQVHGARVVVVDGPGGADGEAADAAVSHVGGAALAVLTADCAPVALSSPEGVFGVAHAGWRGLRAGVIEATVQAMRRLGATRVEAVLGPCIHPCCYAFGAGELVQLESRLGASVKAVDREGRPALDVPAAVRSALHLAGASLVGQSGVCTSCLGGYWSWRRSATSHRQAMVAWRACPAGP